MLYLWLLAIPVAVIVYIAYNAICAIVEEMAAEDFNEDE